MMMMMMIYTQEWEANGVQGVQGTQGCGVLMWECAGSLADGNIFFSVPLDGTVLLFSVTVFAGGPDGLAGQKGGAHTVTLLRRWPLPVDAV